MTLPIESMLRDAAIVERTLGEDMAVSPVADVCLHVKALVGECERLRRTLEPFAQQARIIDENDAKDGHGPEEDCYSFRFRSSYAAITIGDCRRALEAMR